ncbi:clathrin adaptor, mu subunit [Metschnikowia bicuspidata]|uniref:Clathrin adaptor, mu subunit n=1 Tax=Metschnikowia bicuspidata TaxID=27322 RepID=A0A4P9ZDX5_9ASCO|nr:clathrin adaptor, mu subunit [Metschnikowia bicuspidata]
MFQSIYITDANHALTYEYLVFPNAPAFADIGAHVAAKLRDSPELLFHRLTLDREHYVCAYSTPSIIVCLLCLNGTGATNPLYPSVFLHKLVRAAEDYFGAPLAPTKLSVNSDTLTLLINEMIVNGVPHTTEANNLKDIVLQKSLLSNIIRAGNQLASAAANKTLAYISTAPVKDLYHDSDAVPWRKTTVKYTNNEMFVDVVECVSAVLRATRKKNKISLLSNSNFDSAFYSTSSFTTSTKLTPVTRTITGNIDFTSHISGVPQLNILLNSAAVSMEAVLLHRCINAAKWKTSRVLLFIPPDGLSTLLSYTIDLDKPEKKNQSNALGLLDFDCETAMGPHQDEFEFRIISLTSSAVSKIELIKVEVYAFEPQNAVSDIKSTRVTDGDFVYKGRGVGHWTIKNLQAGGQSVLRAAIRRSTDSIGSELKTSSNENLLEVQDASKELKRPFVHTHFQVSYIYKGLVPSGLRVDSLELVSCKGLGESVKPYKGVKYITQTEELTIRTK